MSRFHTNVIRFRQAASNRTSQNKLNMPYPDLHSARDVQLDLRFERPRTSHIKSQTTNESLPGKFPPPFYNSEIFKAIRIAQREEIERREKIEQYQKLQLEQKQHEDWLKYEDEKKKNYKKAGNGDVLGSLVSGLNKLSQLDSLAVKFGLPSGTETLKSFAGYFSTQPKV